MKMEALLSRGAVAAIAEGALPAGAFPLLQVFRLTVMGRGAERHGMLLSDGAHFIGATLPASMDHLVADGRVRRGTVVHLRELTSATTTLGGSRVIEIKQLEVLQTESEMIGNPNAYRSSHLEHNHEKLDVDSEASSEKLNCGSDSGGQGLKWHLTKGVLAVLQLPEMQVVGVSLLKIKRKEEYCHLILSDGVHTLNAVLGPFLNHLIDDNHLHKGTIVRLLAFSYYTIRSLSMVDISALEVLQTECELIGCPKAYELSCIEKPYVLEGNSGESYCGSLANHAQPNNGPYSSCQDLKWYLTHGAVTAIMKGEILVEERPVIQVVDYSLVSQNGFNFYRILLSDGVHQVYANLFPHLSHLVDDNILRKGTRVRLLKFIRDTFDQDRNYRTTIAVELEVLNTNTECELIGSPTFYELGNKQEEVDAGHAACVSLDDLAQSDGGSHPTGQDLKVHLTRGMVALLQQLVMQVVTVSMTRSELKKFGMYNLILSDGTHAHDAVLVSKLNHLVKDTHIRRGTIVHLLEVVSYFVQSPSMIVVMDIEVLQTECELIGSPKASELCCIEKPQVLEGKRGEPYPRSVANYAQPMDGPHGRSFNGHLTGGAVAAFVEGEITVELQPVMQVDYVPRQPSDGYNIVLSDGIHKMYGFLLPHLRYLLNDKSLRDGTIVRVLKIVFENRYFSILDLEVLQTECELIGRPTFYMRGNKQNEWADHAAYIPEGDAAQRTGESHPRYKATPG